MSDTLSIETIHRPRLSPPELRELVGIEALCYAPQTRYDARTIQRFLRSNGGMLIRARIDRDLAGFLMADTRAGHLITLDVHPDRRRCGLGTRLMRTALDELRRAGARFAHSEVAVDNAASLRLHEKLGFTRVSRIENYYEDGEDAAVMALRLIDSDPDEADR